MEIPKQLIDCLDQNKVEYEILHHAEAVTAQRIAQAEHVKGRHQAKVVMIKSGDQHLMIVLPADHHIDLEKIEKAVGKPVSLDRENDFKSLFPDSAIGAMPPFGNLYGLPTYVDKHLAEQDYIVFEAGTHTDAIKMSYQRLRENREAKGRRPRDQASPDERSLSLADGRAAIRTKRMKIVLTQLLIFGWPALRHRQRSPRRKLALSMSTARSGPRQRVTFPEASKKPRRKMCSAW